MRLLVAKSLIVLNGRCNQLQYKELNDVCCRWRLPDVFIKFCLCPGKSGDLWQWGKRGWFARKHLHGSKLLTIKVLRGRIHVFNALD